MHLPQWVVATKACCRLLPSKRSTDLQDYQRAGGQPPARFVLRAEPDGGSTGCAEAPPGARRLHRVRGGSAPQEHRVAARWRCRLERAAVSWGPFCGPEASAPGTRWRLCPAGATESLLFGDTGGNGQRASRDRSASRWHAVPGGTAPQKLRALAYNPCRIDDRRLDFKIARHCSCAPSSGHARFWSQRRDCQRQVHGL
jgi:hypothetical protein